MSISTKTRKAKRWARRCHTSECVAALADDILEGKGPCLAAIKVITRSARGDSRIAAEEALANLFLKILQNSDKLMSMSSADKVGRYVYRMALHAAISEVRCQKTRSKYIESLYERDFGKEGRDELALAEEKAEAKSAMKEASRVILAEAKELSNKNDKLSQRFVAELILGAPGRGIATQAESVGIRPNAISVRWAAARKNLRRELEAQMPPEDMMFLEAVVSSLTLAGIAKAADAHGFDPYESQVVHRVLKARATREVKP